MPSHALNLRPEQVADLVSAAALLQRHAERLPDPDGARALAERLGRTLSPRAARQALAEREMEPWVAPMLPRLAPLAERAVSAVGEALARRLGERAGTAEHSRSLGRWEWAEDRWSLQVGEGASSVAVHLCIVQTRDNVEVEEPAGYAYVGLMLDSRIFLYPMGERAERGIVHPDRLGMDGAEAELALCLEQVEELAEGLAARVATPKGLVAKHFTQTLDGALLRAN
jgi:hypothetical protein